MRRGKDLVGFSELQEAVERVIAGLEKKNRVLNPKEKERVAHHEVGHALVALTLPGMDAVQKISIIPRGVAALGYTLQLPTEDRFLMTKSELENKIAVLLGGRVAEELIYHEISTGARDDLLKATDIAKSMVKAYGMSEKLGQISFDGERQPLFLQTGLAPVENLDEVRRWGPLALLGFWLLNFVFSSSEGAITFTPRRAPLLRRARRRCRRGSSRPPPPASACLRHRRRCACRARARPARRRGRAPRATRRS